MRTRVWRAYVIVMFLAAPAALAQTQVVVKTESGLVAGTGTDIHVWKGIPYARPPVGELRWKKRSPRRRGRASAMPSNLAPRARKGTPPN